jgi:hypothetical protein
MDDRRKTILAIVALAFLIGAVAVFYGVRQGDRQVGSTPLDFNRCAYVAWTFLWTFCVVFAAWATGVRLLSRFHISEVTTLERGLFSLALGFSCIIALAFAAAAIGFYRPIAVLSLVYIFIVFRTLRRRTGGYVTPQLVNSSTSELSLWFRPFAVAVLVILMLPNLLGCLTPPSTWDELTYHLVIPKTYIEHGGFARADYLVYFDIPHNVNLLYGFALAAHSPESAHLLHFAFGIMTAGLLLALGKRFYNETSGWFAALIFLTTPVVMLETRAAMVDVAMAFFFLAAVYALFLWWETGRARFVTLAAVFTGILTGCKYQGIYGFVVLLVMLLAVSARREKHFSLGHIRALIVFVIVSALIIAPWLVKNALATGNPVYPNLYGIFGGKDWSPQLADHLRLWLHSMGMGKGIRDFFLLPWRLTVRGAHSYSRFSGILTPFYFFSLPLLVFTFLPGQPGRRTRITLRLLALFIIYLAIWFLGSQQMRFLIPALALLALVSGDIFAQVFKPATASLKEGESPPLRTGPLACHSERSEESHSPVTNLPFKDHVSLAGISKIVSRRRQTGWLLALVFVFVGLISISADLSDVYLEGANISLAFGTGNRDDFLTHVRGVDVHPMILYINSSLPKDARILMLFENRGYYLTRSYIADGTFEVSRIIPWFSEAATPQETLEILKRRGITHILLNQTYAADYSGNFIRKFYPNFTAKFEIFRQSYLEEAKRIGNVILFKVSG